MCYNATLIIRTIREDMPEFLGMFNSEDTQSAELVVLILDQETYDPSVLKQLDKPKFLSRFCSKLFAYIRDWLKQHLTKDVAKYFVTSIDSITHEVKYG